MRSCFSFSVAFLILALGAAAGAAAPPPAKPDAAKSQILTPLQNDDPKKVAAAKEFIQLYHPRMSLAMVKQMLDKFMPRSIAAKKARDPKFDARTYEKEMRERVMKGSAEKLDTQARIVSRHFTLPELQSLILFFKAPLGKKLVAETPKIQRDMLTWRRANNLNMPGSMLKSQNDDEEDEDDVEDKPKTPSKVLHVKPQPKK